MPIGQKKETPTKESEKENRIYLTWSFVYWHSRIFQWWNWLFALPLNQLNFRIKLNSYKLCKFNTNNWRSSFFFCSLFQRHHFYKYSIYSNTVEPINTSSIIGNSVTLKQLPNSFFLSHTVSLSLSVDYSVSCSLILLVFSLLWLIV